MENEWASLYFSLPAVAVALALYFFLVDKKKTNSAKALKALQVASKGELTGLIGTLNRHMAIDATANKILLYEASSRVKVIEPFNIDKWFVGSVGDRTPAYKLVGSLSVLSGRGASMRTIAAQTEVMLWLNWPTKMRVAMPADDLFPDDAAKVWRRFLSDYAGDKEEIIPGLPQ